MQKAGLSLAFFAFVSVLFVAVTDQLTKDRIAQNKRQMLLSALNQVVPENRYDNDLINDRIILKSEQSGFERDAPVYFATKNGKLVAAIFEVTTLKGYGGAIKILIGINANTQSTALHATAAQHTIAGVRVIEHTETPGLGDRMEANKSDWVLSFNDKYIGDPPLSGWYVKKDGGQFDQFTGATITPRAIVNAVRTTLLYASDHLQQLYDSSLKNRTDSHNQATGQVKP